MVDTDTAGVTGVLNPDATTCVTDKVQARGDKIHKLAPKASCNVSFIYSTDATTKVSTEDTIKVGYTSAKNGSNDLNAKANVTYTTDAGAIGTSIETESQFVAYPGSTSILTVKNDSANNTTINNLKLNISEDLAPAIETPVLAGGNAIDLAPGAEHTFTIKFKDGGELTQDIVDKLKVNEDDTGKPMIGV